MDRTSLEKQVSDKIAETRDIYHRLYKRERRGLLLEETLRQALLADGVKALDELFRENGLRRQIDHGSWPRFINDLTRFRGGIPADTLNGTDWFLYDPSADCHPAPDVKKARGSAPDWAKEQFFRVIDEYRVSPEYLTPMPKDIPDPNDTLTHQYHDGSYHLVRFECIDDDGFLSDPDPAGKHFSLIGDNGTRAEITIRHVYGPGEQVRFRNYYLPRQTGSMDADGWLEGYMAERAHSLDILRVRGRTLTFEIAMDRDDERTFYSYPLWKEYFAWGIRSTCLLNDCLFKHYREECEKEKAT